MVLLRDKMVNSYNVLLRLLLVAYICTLNALQQGSYLRKKGRSLYARHHYLSEPFPKEKLALKPTRHLLIFFD